MCNDMLCPINSDSDDGKINGFFFFFFFLSRISNDLL